MKNINYTTAYLMRKTSMTLTEIGGLTLKQFREILIEVHYQEAVEDYQIETRLETLLAAIANTVPRKPPKTYKSTDFFKSKPPRRPGLGNAVDDEKEQLKLLANRFDIKLPVKEMREL